MRPVLSLALLSQISLGLTGCGDDTTTEDSGGTDTGTATVIDLDEDGWSVEQGDCDDSDPLSFPGGIETCDGVADEDCDDVVDEDSAADVVTWYQDEDQDGFGDPDVTEIDCEEPPGFVTDNTDCDDGDDTVFPGASELCDGQLNDCDGSGLPETESDVDGDGHVACTWDEDGWDGSPAVTGEEDCDDGDANSYPGADELCDGADRDCDGTVDEENALDAWTTFVDADGDGYGDSLDSGQTGCTHPTGRVEEATDCDDDDASVNPGATEICDEQDNDCDGLVDGEDPDLGEASTYYIDHDGDGHGSTDYTAVACEAPGGFVDVDTDCDDTDAAVNPDASEICDEVDNDCDGDVDDADTGVTGLNSFYADADLDGYGDPDNSSQSCEAVSGHVDDATDCDDTDGAIHPGASEVCDELDNDCDGLVDDEDSVLDGASSFYIDHDGDGHGSTDYTIAACEVPSGYVENTSDCDDADADSHPDASELCDEADNDCDGDIDEDGAADGSTWYGDGDGDGYGDPLSTTESCEPASGYVDDATDCDDDDSAIHPDATEICDEADNDCDGLVDDEDTHLGGTSTFYIDHDEDGYGSTDYIVASCVAPSGYVEDATDCDDAEADTHPDATEVCDELDNDCDGLVDDDDTDLGGTTTFHRDSDGDGYGASETTTDACEIPSGHVEDASDCDDGDATIHPEATEVCDETDNDCDGDTDEDDAADVVTWYADNDGDGYGDPANTTDACEVPSGHVDDATDCDDERSGVYPFDSDGDGVSEFCGFTAVSSGFYHSCVLDLAGTIECWGRDDSGQASGAPSGSGYTAVNAAGYHSCAIDSSGGIECWGSDADAQVTDAPTDTGYTAVSGGSYHGCAIDSAGVVECWGSDGNGNVSDSPWGTGYTILDAAHRHTCAIDSSGYIACWGDDTEGQASDAPSDSGFLAVSGGGYHTCAMDSVGGIDCWGVDDGKTLDYGQVSYAPTSIGYLALSSNEFQSCAADATGTIQCWGAESDGQITDVPVDTDYIDLSGGWSHTCALHSSGSIDCWGWDFYGQVTSAP